MGEGRVGVGDGGVGDGGVGDGGLGGGEGLGVGLGDGEGEGDGEGDGTGEGVGPCFVFPLRSGCAKSWGGIFEVATCMKSCQIAAGMVPPKTLETPSMSCMGMLPFGKPTQTQVTS